MFLALWILKQCRRTMIDKAGWRKTRRMGAGLANYVGNVRGSLGKQYVVLWQNKLWPKMHLRNVLETATFWESWKKPIDRNPGDSCVEHPLIHHLSLSRVPSESVPLAWNSSVAGNTVQLDTSLPQHLKKGFGMSWFEL